jgi:hypothetical protein
VRKERSTEIKSTAKSFMTSGSFRRISHTDARALQESHDKRVVQANLAHRCTCDCQILHDKRVVQANLAHRCTCAARIEIISRYTSAQFCADELCMLLLGMLLGGVHMLTAHKR